MFDISKVLSRAALAALVLLSLIGAAPTWATPALSIGNVSQAEGASGNTTMTFTVQLDMATAGAFTVDYYTTDGSATAGSDYTGVAFGTPGTLNFAGDASETHNIVVDIAGDAVVELDETFTVTLSNVVGETVSLPGPATGTIQNDDSATITIANVSSTEGNSGGTKVFSFAVSMDAVVDTSVSIDYSTADNEATTADNDYTSVVSSTLTFPALSGAFQYATVSVSSDTKVEALERFYVNLSNLDASGRSVSIGDAQALGSIQNDDSATLSVADGTLAEDGGSMSFTVTLSDAVQGGVTVQYSTTDGTATTADGDYTSTSTPDLSFTGTEGETKNISVPITSDTKVELDEDFTVHLDSFSVAPGVNDVSIFDNQATGTIQNDDAATISISDVSAAEGNAGTQTYTFNVTLSAAVDTGVGVNYAAADDSATVADSDYAAVTPGTLTFTAGTTGPETVSVTVNGDTDVETNESFFVNLSGISASGRNVTLADNQGVGTIENDDSATLSINDVSTSEGNGGTKNLNFTVTLSDDTPGAVSVNFATADGTATTADSDYNAAAGTLNFTGTAGETKIVSVQVVGDTKVELGETFVVNLYGVVGAGVVLGDDQGQGTITNDDSATFSIDDVTQLEGDAGTSAFQFTVTLSAAVDVGVSVNFASADNTATTAGNDYLANSGTLNFTGTAGETKTATVNVQGDTDQEPTETFFVNLSNEQVSGRNVTIGDGQGLGTITNDETVYLSINDVATSEGNGGTKNLNFTVTLSDDVAGGASVQYATANGSATVGDSDYAAKSGTLNFTGTAGETKIISVQINGDTKVELNETFVVNLSNPTGANVEISDNQGQGTINNDDAAQFSVADVSQAEGAGNMTFTVSLSLPVDAATSVNVSTVNGTATTGDNDYNAVSAQTVNFAAGQTSKNFTVTVNDDIQLESDETFTVTLSGVVDGGRNVTAGSGATGTIENDDNPELSINDVMLGEGDAGTVTFTFTVTLSVSAPFTVTTDYATADDEATSGSDYTAKSGTLTFNPGVTSRPITVSVSGDTVEELPQEDFFVQLSNPTGATILDGQGQGTIVDDDDLGPPQVTSVKSGAAILSECDEIRSGLSSLQVTFSEPLRDPAGNSSFGDVTAPDGYQLFAAGANGNVTTTACGTPNGDDVLVPVNQVTFNSSTNTADVQFGSVGNGLHNLILCGDGALLDLAGNALDGDGNNLAGDDFSRVFRVEYLNLFPNGQLDCNLASWTQQKNNASEIVHDTDDALASSFSGSARLTNLTMGTNFGLSQCLPVQAGVLYTMESSARVVSSAGALALSNRCELFSGLSCGGSSLGLLIKAIPKDVTWSSATSVFETPAGTASMRCKVDVTAAGGAGFEVHVDGISLTADASIFSDGFESGTTSNWSSSFGEI